MYPMEEYRGGRRGRASRVVHYAPSLYPRLSRPFYPYPTNNPPQQRNPINNRYKYSSTWLFTGWPRIYDKKVFFAKNFNARPPAARPLLLTRAHSFPLSRYILLSRGQKLKGGVERTSILRRKQERKRERKRPRSIYIMWIYLYIRGAFSLLLITSVAT